VEGHQRNKLTMDINKDSIIVHEDYNASTIVNDVALIKLNVPLPLSKNNSIYYY
jgi:secreted trypsin-like serine protease